VLKVKVKVEIATGEERLSVFRSIKRKGVGYMLLNAFEI